MSVMSAEAMLDWEFGLIAELVGPCARTSALIDSEKVLDYGELDRLVDRVAGVVGAPSREG